MFKDSLIYRSSRHARPFAHPSNIDPAARYHRAPSPVTPPHLSPPAQPIASIPPSPHRPTAQGIHLFSISVHKSPSVRPSLPTPANPLPSSSTQLPPPGQIYSESITRSNKRHSPQDADAKGTQTFLSSQLPEQLKWPGRARAERWRRE